MKVKSSRRPTSAWLVAAAILLSTIFGQGLPAFAAPFGLTVVANGGAAEGSGWTYNSGSTPAVISITQNVNINASDIVAKLAANSLVLEADDITINADVLSITPHSFTVRATRNIKAIAGVDIETNGGSVTLQSNSSDSGFGQIWLGNLAAGGGSIVTNGGDIFLGGGSNLATGYAMASNIVGQFESTKVYAGIAMYGFGLNAGGGDISLRGGGIVDLNTRAVLIEQNAAAVRSTFQTTGSGRVSIVGDGSSLQYSSGNRWGPTFSGVNIGTEYGDIQIIGKSGTGGVNARGVVMVNMNITSTTGDISIDDTTDGSPANYSGMYLGATISKLSTSGNIVIRADEYISEGTLELVGPSATIKPFTGNSFTESRPLGLIDADQCEEFTFGQTVNTTAMSINQPITFGGDASFLGGSIAFSGAQSASAGVVRIQSSGTVTQSAAIISRDLALQGTGSFNLTNASNNFSNVAGGTNLSRLNFLNLTDAAGGLTVGQAGSLSGIYASGQVQIATTSGNLEIQQPIDSIASSGDSVKLFANKPAAAASAGDGDIRVTGAGTVAVTSSARALLYSGSRATSSGLTALVGGEANARSLVAATTDLATLSAAVTLPGTYALYRTDVPAPTFSVRYFGNSNTSGSVPASTNSSSAQTISANSGNLVRTGFTFGGWNTRDDGLGTPYASGSVVTLSADLDLYAVWTAVPSPPASSPSNPSPPISIPPTPEPVEPVPAVVTKVDTVQLLPGSKPGLSKVKVKLQTPALGSITTGVKVKLFDFSGKLVREISIPTTDQTGSIEIDVDLKLGDFDVEASTFSAAGVTEAVSARPQLVRKALFNKAPNGASPSLFGAKLREPIFFKPNSAILSTQSKTILRAAVEKLKGSDKRVAITGFSVQWNKGRVVEQNLAQQRALNVGRYLRAQGFENWIYYAGFGGVASGEDDAKNRKVELRVIK